MNIDDEAVKVISKCVVDAINTIVPTLPYNIAQQGRIKQVLINNFYIVTIEGADYTVPSLTDMTYVINENVWVTKLNNDEKQKVIIGRRRN